MKKNKNKCDLQSCFFCKLCLKEWHPVIESQRQLIEYRKGETIFAEGDVVTGVFFLNKGKAKVHMKWGDDKELIARFVGPGDIIGHRGLGKESHYPVSATALENAVVCFIDLDFFHASLRVNYDFIHDLLMFYASELQESEKKMRNMAHMPVKGRIAYALLKLKERFGVDENGNLDINISRQDLASYAGTTYETTFRTMTELMAENLVKVVGKDIVILNEEQLKKLTV